MEIWVRRAVPAMVALFAGALVAISVVITRDAYDRALTDAFTDLELTAGVISSSLDTTFREHPNADLTAALAQAMPSRALASGQQVIVSDAASKI
ncbi:MAG TPA: PAS domain-containing sensor histidine kinase, partial [Methylocella sp.]|nr:PAS domain-containing sensor histidine kinase [Methylocella sp.]